MKKRILSLLLVLVMIVALAACGTAKTDDAAKADDTAKTDDTAAAEEPYKIVWYYGGTAQPDIQMVQEAMAEYCNETYGMNIELDMIATAYGDLQQKMAMVLSSGEKWDLCFTSTWANNFAANAGQGAYLALEELLPEYAPEMYDYIGAYWGSVTNDGHIWAVPNIQLEYKYAFSSIPTKWVEMYNATNPEVPLTQENVNYIADFNDFFYWAKENVIAAGVDLNGVVPSWPYGGNQGDSMAYLVEDTGVAGTYLTYGDESLTVKSMWDFPEWIESFDIQNNWYRDGIEQSDIVGLDRQTSDFATLQWMQYSHPTFKPGEDANQYRYWGLSQENNELTFFTHGDAWAYNGAVTATLTAVNANCENPEVVLQFLNYLNTDATLFNICCFGIEGYHYEVGEDGCVHQLEAGANYNPNNDWGFGNQFLAIPREGQSADVWEQTAKMNETCKATCAMGFNPVTDNVVTQVANLSAVGEQYSKTFNASAVPGTAEDWEAFKEAYKQAQYDAGLQDVIDDVQAQINAWAGK